MKTIKNFDSFVEVLQKSGFSMGGRNAEKVFSLLANDPATGIVLDDCIAWHTGNPETDPWEWRMRVVEERDDIAYSKVFFKKSGYITRTWYPYFLAVRRKGMTFDEVYDAGLMSQFSRRIYDLFSEDEMLPLHQIKEKLQIQKSEKSAFDRAMVDLQMNLFITISGRQQKISQSGESYGWSSTVFTTCEKFFGRDLFQQALQIDPETAVSKIRDQILSLNPSADDKRVRKFIEG